MIAADVMTREVIAVDERSTLADAASVMSERGIRHLPVLRSGSALVGILSDRELREFRLSRVSDMASFEKWQARLRTPVSKIMSADIVSVQTDTDLDEVIELMIEEGVGALPVVDTDSDELVGMVSYVDVLRAARDALREVGP